jgi:RNA polymerase sigma-70 factor (ECF subfamily)
MPAIQLPTQASPTPERCDTDRQLLERYVAHGDEGAFTTLVRRHAVSVLRACRRVLPHLADAEDVSQQTFVLLARRSRSIAWRASIRGWLCAVARRQALHARSALARSRRREELRGLFNADGYLNRSAESALADAARRELRSVVVSELDQLPEKYRAPAILCYLEGKTNQEAARLLGWPAGSMSRRLARARSLLHDRLTRKGFPLLVLLLLSVTGLFHLNRDMAADQVAQVMSDLRGPAAVLDRLETDPRAVDPAEIRNAAWQSAAAADRIRSPQSHLNRTGWERDVAAMHESAVALADALRGQDEQTILHRARRLHATCQHCHLVFRR